MAGKTGKRPTGRKPTESTRQGAKTDGAFGKEGMEQISSGATARNVHKSVRKKVRTGGAGGLG